MLSMLLMMCLATFSFAQKAVKNDAAKTNAEIIHLTKETFLKNVWDYEKNPQEWKYKGKKPCIIDFYAHWCGPCRLFAKTLQSVADEQKDNIICYKINIDEQKELARIFGTSSIPSILFVPMEGKPQMAKGNIPKSQVDQIVKDFLMAKPK